MTNTIRGPENTCRYTMNLPLELRNRMALLIHRHLQESNQRMTQTELIIRALEDLLAKEGV